MAWQWNACQSKASLNLRKPGLLARSRLSLSRQETPCCSLVTSQGLEAWNVRINGGLKFQQNKQVGPGKTV